MNVRHLLALLIIAVGLTVAADERPNIVLIMADDMGYSDVGCYGGEINTPNIDYLAAEGLRFTQFYNTGRCCPTRASLMTGLYPHEAGLGHMVYDDKGTGYHPYLNQQCVTIAEVLRDSGYRTLMAGKWHVGHAPGQWPTDRGFEQFYGIHLHVDSYFKVLPGCPVYHNDQLVIEPTENPTNTLNPGQPWYTTDVFTDWSLKFLDEAADDNRPFFLYTAFNSPHWPLEAPEENIASVKGRYDAGWDVLREQKLQRMRQLGLVSHSTQLSPSNCPEWLTRSEDDRRNLAFRREIYAAQIERMDENIGRIVARLKQLGKLDNTLLLFLSDNGCCAEGGMSGYQWKKNRIRNYAQWRQQSGRSSSTGEAWSNASNTPFRLHKRWVHEGGIATPLIVHWPQVVVAGGRVSHQPGHVVDVMATCLDVAGATYPSKFDGRSIKPASGLSLLSSLRDSSAKTDRTLYWEHETHAAIRQGDWKLVTENGTDETAWELYDLSRTRTETENVAAQYPERVDQLKSEWMAWATQANVLPWPQHRQPAEASVQRPLPFLAKFETGELDDWEFYGGDWSAQSGVLAVSGDRGSRAVLKSLRMASFELQVDVCVHDPDTQAGVVFRTGAQKTGIDAYEGYYVGIHPDRNNAMWGASAMKWRAIARKPAAFAPNKWYRLRLLADENNVKLFVDGRPVKADPFAKIDGVDQQFTAGGIGLRVLGGRASFRNLIIRDVAADRLSSGNTQSSPLKPAVDGKLPAAVTYTNPVQAACADPAILKHHGRYYAYCTYSPDFPTMPQGIRLYVSDDLVHWRDHGYALKNADSWGESRFWAPDVIEQDGTFYMYYAADTRICVATAQSPLGPFKQLQHKPMLPESIRIDAHVFKDNDGQTYFYYVHFNDGNQIWGGKLNDDMLSVDESSLRLMVKPDQPWERQMGNVTEGAVVVRRGDTYYLTYSGSHFESPDYAVGYATSDSPLGPWDKYELNPIMKSTAYAHGTAHHCLTTSPDDSEMFIVYHRHHTLTETEPRQMALDRIRFVAQETGPDVLEVWGPTSSPQPVPSMSVFSERVPHKPDSAKQRRATQD